MSYFAASPVRETTVEARVIRADGTVEELGTIAYWHRSWFKRAAWRIKQLARGRKPGRITQR
ncbi:hypothetical protein [Achromobacter sp.]|uniref:hypothetical protein n=1 Tax=Achromobacter sp. TaxID=134375 RepID=UPI002F957C36